MRKAMLAAALVGAAFAGGAVVNGPGLKWAQGMLLNGADRGDSIPNLDDALERSRARADKDGDGPRVGRAALAARSGPDAEKADDEDGKAPAESGAAPKVEKAEPAGPPRPIGEPEKTSPGPEVPAPPPPAITPPAEVGDSREAKAGHDEESAPKGEAAAPGPSAPPAPLTRPSAAPARLDPDVKPANLPPVPPAPLSPGAGEDGPDRRWADLRRRLKELGVGRYWIEGDGDGPARFRCVVPLPGQRTVGQQFEAEADDPMAAAETALKRVVLWRATEAP